MFAYHNDQTIKDKYVARAIEHRKADEILQGYGYWIDGKGCAIGCLAHVNSGAHEALEADVGIPLMVSRLADVIFEGLPSPDFKAWPQRFADSIRPGADLSLVGWQFLYWNLTENLVLHDSDNAEVQKTIIQCREAIKRCGGAICPLTKGEKVNESAALSAEYAARSAAYAKMANKLIELIEAAA